MLDKEKYIKSIQISNTTLDEVNSMIDRVRVLISYRAEMSKKILEQYDKEQKDLELIDLLEHMYQHYNDLIKQSLNLD